MRAATWLQLGEVEGLEVAEVLVWAIEGLNPIRLLCSLEGRLEGIRPAHGLQQGVAPFLEELSLEPSIP